MSEAEAFELFVMIVDQQNQLFFGYFSVVTAFLILCYFAAEKLDRIISGVVLTLYTLSCAWFFIGLYGWSNDVSMLYAEMITKKSDGVYELAWFGSNPDWLPTAVVSLHLLLTLGGWLISVGYFFYKRTRIDRTEL